MKKEYNYPAIIVLTVPIIAFIASFFIFEALNWKSYLFLFISWVLMNGSVVVGWHRYFSHGQFKTSSFIEFIFILFGSASLNGSVVEWVSEHSAHHRYPEDFEKDPHCPSRGFFYAHMGWLFYKRDSELKKELFNNKLLKWQHYNWKWFSFLVGVIIPFGIYYYFVNSSLLESFMIGVLVRLFITQQTILLLNSWAHYFGKSDESGKSSAKNSVLVALLCFGDGYHLNHHRNPSDYRAGNRWHDLDVSKWFIYLGSKLGLFWDLKK